MRGGVVEPDNKIKELCPFCLGNKVIQRYNPMGARFYWIYCPECDRSGPVFARPQDAVADWKDRYDGSFDES